MKENETTDVDISDNHSDVIRSMVDTILQDKNSDAQSIFKDIIGAKMADAIENKKIELAQTIYSRED